jgi:TIR domain-containing protein
LITRSPHDFVVPRAGRWHIVAHTWGLRNSARISVAQLQQVGPMAPAQPHQVDLASIAANAAQYGGAEEALPVAPAQKDYDVFVCHASEDKDTVVRPLAEALRQEGLSVWYDEFELRIGTSLRRSIDAGLANSRFGAVVLSESFFGKGWSNYELDGLVTREVAQSGTQIILPIWHKVTKDEVTAYSPSLADKLALRTADSTVSEIAAEIASVVQDRIES